MAHLMAPQPSAPGLPVFFNVDGVVGAAPAQNLREDVLLVQFFFSVIAKNVTEPAAKAVLGAVKVTGVIDAPTIAAIKDIQERHKKNNPGAIVDGRMSPAKGGYNYGGGHWAITRLNDNAQDKNKDHWPRIDKIAGCPDEIKLMVVRTLVGT
jgi:uncharacterized membrane protein